MIFLILSMTIRSEVTVRLSIYLYIYIYVAHKQMYDLYAQ